MTDLIFVDTNLVLYTLGEDKRKKAIARAILAKRPILSTQVINEAVNVCLRRFKFTPEQSYAFADLGYQFKTGQNKCRVRIAYLDKPNGAQCAPYTICPTLHW